MTTHPAQQVWLAMRIWLLAVAANTMIGCLYLTGLFNDTSLLFLLILYGTFFGGLYSFPVFLLLIIIINRCVAGKVNGLKIFRIVFIAGLPATVIVWKVFDITNSDFPKSHYSFLLIALLSAIIGISLHYKSLFKMGLQDEQLESFLSKETH